MLAGELDASTAGALYMQLAELAKLGVRHVALNLAELTFMDSTGLSVMIAEHNRVESMGGELIIFSPCDCVRRVFEVTGLCGFLNVRPQNRGTVAKAPQGPNIDDVKPMSLVPAAPGGLSRD